MTPSVPRERDVGRLRGALDRLKDEPVDEEDAEAHLREVVGALILHGTVPWLKIALNYATPFTVASLGFLSARRRSSVERLARLLERDGGADPPSGA